MFELVAYTFKVLPGCLLFIIVYLLIPKDKAVGFKIALLIMGFVLLRDAMTPMGFWQLGLTDSVLWVRFIDEPFILLGLGFTSILLTIGIVLANPKMRDWLSWSGDSTGKSIIVGIIGSFAVSLPLLFMYRFVPLSERGGEVATILLIPLLWMTIAGNFMEEVLFRGYLQGYFGRFVGKYRAAFLSGLMFAAGHTFLATTVTGLGWPILVFTLYEGIICALVRIKHGMIGSTLTHGLAIFFLAAGFV